MSSDRSGTVSPAEFDVQATEQENMTLEAIIQGNDSSMTTLSDSSLLPVADSDPDASDEKPASSVPILKQEPFKPTFSDNATRSVVRTVNFIPLEEEAKSYVINGLYSNAKKPSKQMKLQQTGSRASPYAAMKTASPAVEEAGSNSLEKEDPENSYQATIAAIEQGYDVETEMPKKNASSSKRTLSRAASIRDALSSLRPYSPSTAATDRKKRAASSTSNLKSSSSYNDIISPRTLLPKETMKRSKSPANAPSELDNLSKLMSGGFEKRFQTDLVEIPSTATEGARSRHGQLGLMRSMASGDQAREAVKSVMKSGRRQSSGVIGSSRKRVKFEDEAAEEAPEDTAVHASQEKENLDMHDEGKGEVDDYAPNEPTFAMERDDRQEERASEGEMYFYDDVNGDAGSGLQDGQWNMRDEAAEQSEEASDPILAEQSAGPSILPQYAFDNA